PPLGNGRDLQQRHTRDRRLPLGPGRELPHSGHVHRGALSLRRRLGVPRYAGSLFRVRGRQDHYLAGAELQRPDHVRPRARPGHIAQSTGRALRIDATSGRITGDEEAMKTWQREYAPGWTPVV